MIRQATAAGLILTALSWSPLRVVAQDANCGSDDFSLGCVAEDEPEPKPREVVTGQPGGSNETVSYETPPLEWSRYYIPPALVEPVPCSRETELADRVLVEYAAEWLVIVQRVDTGDLVTIYTFCEWPGDDPPRPPAPPTPPGEFDSETREPLELGSSFSPPPDGIGGVSQLPTWLWCTDPGSISVDAAVGTARSEATVDVVAVTWRVSGPDGTFDLPSSDGCGSEPAIDSDGETAAAVWTPDRPGDYELTLTTSWGGTWFAELLLDGVGWIRYGPFGLEPIPVASEPVPYRVVEIQTVGGERSGD